MIYVTHVWQAAAVKFKGSKSIEGSRGGTLKVTSPGSLGFARGNRDRRAPDCSIRYRADGGDLGRTEKLPTKVLAFFQMGAGAPASRVNPDK